ncbi:MAG TPA: helix-turn-helix domain-containing protein [Rectinemataceae bacterium]|nr:helix-turn-helix domain-containing protein [Rectinemataceae bacterium]
MAANGAPDEHCPSEALRLLGDYTTLRIIDFLSGSALRFTDLRRVLDDTNVPTLVARLKRMTKAGLVTRSEATLDGKSVTYELTEDGKALLPVLRAIQSFAQRTRSRA